MEQLRKAFLTSSAGIESIEPCVLPYIYTRKASPSNMDCFIDVFYISCGMVELVSNAPPSEKILSGEIVVLNRSKSEYFILSGCEDTIVIHAKITPCGLYYDLVMCKNHNECPHILRKEDSDALPAAAEMMKLLLLLKSTDSPMSPYMEIPVALFFVQLYLAKSQSLPLSHPIPQHRLSGLMLEMIKNPGFPWRVKDLADSHHMSLNLFISEFKKTSGFTPYVFLKKTRLNRGRQLLEKTDMPVSIIASECGYNSHASFTHYIKKEFGLSPVKIRKKTQKNV
ncbi:helix-turn-helix transcriptional regulator [Salmonella enterica]|nr:helix-turn-helix transcriptional regulator [Salmonella enterica]